MERIAVYPGSFNPITYGHLDIIERSSKLFDTVIVAVGINEKKQYTFSLDERIEMIQKACKGFKNIEVQSFTGLLAEYIKSVKACTVVKGLRALTDFDYEFQMALTNRSINSDFETLFMPARLEYMYLSSSIVREVAKYRNDISKYVPLEIQDFIIERCRKL